MRASGPVEVKPRQLRALVLLLALLPVIPTIFVVRFLVEDIASQRLEARERARPLYQQNLARITAALAADTARQLQPPTVTDSADPMADDPWRWLDGTAFAVGVAPAVVPPADALLVIDGSGNLSLPATPVPPRMNPAAALSAAVLESGARSATVPRAGPPRWRYFSELPEPLFALHPASRPGPAARTDVLLLQTRQHLRERIEGFYEQRRETNSQVAVRLIDENGDGVLMSASADAGSPAAASAVVPAALGEPLAEVSLPAPLPTWRVQVFILDPALVEGIARGQIEFYWWTVGGMFLVTGGLAALAGRALTRRIALHELSNDALAVVSHEMKTPLASTRLFIETLLERRYREGSGQVDEYLRLIADENNRLERLVDGFQTLARLENRRGRARLALEPVVAGEIARAAAARLRSRLEAPECAFVLEGGEETARLRADRDGLVTVLVNLLDNALKYTGDDKRVTLRCRAQGREVWYEVGDNGQGIESGEQRRIFERFYQSDQRLSRAHEGVGLGLSIVRMMVKAHGGTVSIQSTPGEGSVFTVRLPALPTGIGG